MPTNSVQKPPSRRLFLSAAAALAVPASAQQGAPPKLGLIGLGNRAQRHLAAYRELGDVNVAALCDLDPERMAAARQGPAVGAQTYVDYRELIADKTVEAVIIAVPNYLHARMAIEALEAGKDVLLEKPIGINFEEARRVAEAARRSGQILSVGMQRHYYAPYRAILSFLSTGELGTLRQISQSEYRGDWNPKTWRWTDPKTGEKIPWRHRRELAGSSLLEFSVHTYGFLHEMIGSRLARCSATGGADHWPERTTEDSIAVIADYENGVRLSHVYCGFAAGAEWQLTVAGDHGTLQYDRKKAVVRLAGAQPRELDLTDPDGETLSNEARMYRAFFEAVRTRRTPELNADFALEASKLAYAAWMSIDEKRIITAADFA